jgi:hypothetical protein
LASDFDIRAFLERSKPEDFHYMICRSVPKSCWRTQIFVPNDDFCSAIRHYPYFVAKGQPNLPTFATAGRCLGFWAPFSHRPPSFTNFPSDSIVHSLYWCSVLLPSSVGTLSCTPELSLFLRGYPCQEPILPTLSLTFQRFLCDSFWICIQCIYRPCSVTSYANTASVKALVKTSLLLCRVQTCTYRWQHSPSTIH